MYNVWNGLPGGSLRTKNSMTKDEKLAQLNDIIMLRSYGSTFAWIAKKYGVSRQYIHKLYSTHQKKMALEEQQKNRNYY